MLHSSDKLPKNTIGLSKRAIRKTLGGAFITLTELQTLAVEVEGILNDRRTTYVSSDMKEKEPLTPSHLLYGRRITLQPYPVTEDDLFDSDFSNSSQLRLRERRQAATLYRFWNR